jgi:MoaA/NifB/PqqE/SkfB family radical SAM enzyme
MIREREAARIRDLGVETIQVSIYSHRPEVHDGITLVPGSLRRSVDAIRFLTSQGLKVTIANPSDAADVSGLSRRASALAIELGVEVTIDPTITPMMDGDRGVLSLGIGQKELRQVFADESLVGNVEEFCAISAPPGET